MQRAQAILQNIFGYSHFRPLQADIIRALLEGRDVLTLMPTGGGKSLCYQIPALARDGTGIVVSPLIALMQDQVDALRQLGVRAAFLNSTLDYPTARQVERDLLEGALDLLYIAPERLLTETTLSLLDRARLALFAIDEAHCVSQWGHDFRKEYQALSALHERYPKTPRIALTATADRRTRGEIIRVLQLDQAAVFIDSFDRPNIRYAIHERQNARAQLWRFLQREHPAGAGIVYCLSRKQVEAVAAWLTQEGRTALPYHAGLDHDVRQRHQARFLREEGLIIVATIAFGMGIDKPDVRFVAHLNLPKSIEAYYQETGRAGRDGAPADAWMVYGLQDVILLRQMVEDTEADEDYKRVARHKLEALLGLCELTGCRRQALLAYFDETLAAPCGNCDNCLNPPATWDATLAAQQALSCAYRTGQRFGVNYLIGVLQGKTDERIRNHGHDRVSTFGIGRGLSEAEWRTVYRQLLARGYLNCALDQHGALLLTEHCRPLLRGETTLPLRKLWREGKTLAPKSPGPVARSMDPSLWEALRSLRSRLAQAQGVPSYVIFHDATLQEMARLRPQSLEAMRRVSGVGERKLERYGQAFVDVIKAHPVPARPNNTLSDTVNDTLSRYQQGVDVETIARERDLKTTTIYGHLAEGIAAGLLEARAVVSLTDEEYARIVTTMNDLNALEEGRLKPVYEAFQGAYDYEVLRCVLAGLLRK